MLTGTRSSGATSHTAQRQQRVILNAAFAAPMRARTRTPGKQPLMPPKGSSASTSQPQHLPLRQCVLGRELPAANSLLPPAGGVLRRVHSKSGVLPSASTRPQQLRFQSQCLNLIVSPRPVWAQRPSRTSCVINAADSATSSGKLSPPARPISTRTATSRAVENGGQLSASTVTSVRSDAVPLPVVFHVASTFCRHINST